MTAFLTMTGTYRTALRPAVTTPMVFVVDSDVLFRRSLELLLQSSGWAVETFGSPQEFLARAPVPVPNCLICDICLPDSSGLDLHDTLAATRPDTPVIVVAGYGDVRMTVRAMKAGAVEFFLKPLGEDALLGAIRDALDRSRRALDNAAKMRELGERYASLTPRERQVMVLVASGLLNKQAGGELGITEITVKAHRGQVMRKMMADSLPALVHMVARLGLRTTADGGPG
jgi:FixJ family two-component response regulator